MMKKMPAPQMRIYWAVRSTASCGACMSTAMVLAKGTIITHSTMEINPNTSTDPPITGPILSLLSSPIACPISTVTPMERPVITNVTRFRTWLPVETPDRPAVVPNLPTTSRSTAPYIACRTSEPNIGNMNFTSFFRILPEVKLLSFIQYIPVICHLLMYRVNGFNHTDDLLFRYILQYPAYIFIEPGDIERIPCPALFA